MLVIAIQNVKDIPQIKLPFWATPSFSCSLCALLDVASLYKRKFTQKGCLILLFFSKLFSHDLFCNILLFTVFFSSWLSLAYAEVKVWSGGACINFEAIKTFKFHPNYWILNKRLKSFKFHFNMTTFFSQAQEHLNLVCFLLH